MSDAHAATTTGIDAAILLGASVYTNSPQLNNPKFASSAAALREYLLRTLRLSHFLDLFDSDEVLEYQIEAIARVVSDQDVRRLLVYYIGHGGFTAGQRRYYLASRRHKPGMISYTSFDSDALTEVIRGVTRRRGQLFLVLDCCFAGEMLSRLQGDENAALTLMEKRTLDVLPAYGTAFLAASSKHDAAIAPLESDTTLFTGSFLQVLKAGIPGKGAFVSLRDICEATGDLIRSEHAPAPAPEVHAPYQVGGDIAGEPVFPNHLAETDAPGESSSIIDEARTAIGRHVFQVMERSAKQDERHIALDIVRGYVLDAECVEDVSRALLNDVLDAAMFSFSGLFVGQEDGSFVLKDALNWPLSAGGKEMRLGSDNDLVKALRFRADLSGRQFKARTLGFPRSGWRENALLAFALFCDRDLWGIVIYGPPTRGFDVRSDIRVAIGVVMNNASVVLARLRGANALKFR